MNPNLKLAVELYSLGLLRLELPISDKKNFRSNPLSRSQKRVCRMLFEAAISICCTRPKKDRAGEM